MRRVSAHGGCLPRWCLPGGLSAWGEADPGDLEADPPLPVDKMTDACENITFICNMGCKRNPILEPQIGLSVHGNKKQCGPENPECLFKPPVKCTKFE